MELSEFFSSDKKMAIAEFILNHPNAELSARKLAKEVSVSPALASIFIKGIKEGGLAEEKLNLFDPRIRALKLLFNVNLLRKKKAIDLIKKSVKGVKGIGIYGSWANGLNYEDSDLDLWVRVEKQVERGGLAKLRKELKERLAVEPNIIVLNDKRLTELKEKDFVFYCTLHNSFVLEGEQVD
ncbi:MAG: nucleotidyltransferase domain-containing protein [Candidatus Diapherotrites archaeon]